MRRTPSACCVDIIEGGKIQETAADQSVDRLTSCPNTALAILCEATDLDRAFAATDYDTLTSSPRERPQANAPAARRRLDKARQEPLMCADNPTSPDAPLPTERNDPVLG